MKILCKHSKKYTLHALWFDCNFAPAYQSNRIAMNRTEFGDTTLQKCLERLKSWEKNPNRPCEIELYYDFAPYSFGFRERYPDGRIGIEGGLLYHGRPDESLAVLLEPFHGWSIHT